MKNKKTILLLANVLWIASITILHAQHISTSQNQTNGNIYHMGGNIGIGTNTPTYKLDVAGSINATDMRLNGGTLRISRGISDPSVRLIGRENDGHSAIRFRNNADNVEHWAIAAYADRFSIYDQDVQGGAQERMRIDNNGNIGIGKAPAHKLDVNGSINATEIRVNGVVLNSNSLWTQSNSNLYYNAGNVGIGTAGNPAKKFHVEGQVRFGLRGENDPNRHLEFFDDGTFNIRGKGNNGIAIMTDAGFVVRDYGGNTTRFIIKNSGNIGIGTITPAYKLDVNGTINATEILVNGQPIQGGENGGLWSQTQNNTDIYHQSGKVGVGTDTPETTLHIKGGPIKTQYNTTGGVYVQHLLDDDANGYARAAFTHNAVWDHNTNQWHMEAIGANDAQAIVVPNQGGFYFIVHPSTGNATKDMDHTAFMAGSKMQINPTGQVLIGTSAVPAAQYKLGVAGKIISEGYKAQLVQNWPDYVFEKNYDLKPLHEVEAYIQQNKHLPNVPSAAEVQKDGVDLVEINAKLLQKIEEPTLYVIEQEKRIQKLEKQ